MQLATEKHDITQAFRALRHLETRLPVLLRRLRQFIPLEPGARVLDVGAAQGVATTAFLNAGFSAVGIEPWSRAIEVSHELAERTGVDTEIVGGVAESLPFESDSFDLVYSYSVLEHVKDPRAALREAYRVLRPGGGYFFSTTSALCPWQMEIKHFPLFPWYAPRVQRRIMDWAMKSRPEWIGGTEMPAYHWYRHRWMQRELASIGFRRTANRWELRSEDERKGWQLFAVRACRDSRALRLVADLVAPGMEYLAVK